MTVPVDRMRRQPPDARLERRLFHMVAGSTLPVAALFLPSSWALWAAATAAGVWIMVEALRLVLPSLNTLVVSLLSVLLKEREIRRVTGATYLLVATVACFLLFDTGVAVAALLFLSLGDPVAALVGTRLGRWRVGSKSLEGTVAFLAVGLLVGVALWGGGVVESFPVVAVGAAVAALVELLPLPVDDNLRVPLASGAAMLALGL